MKKKLLLFSIILIFSITFIDQSIEIDSLGISETYSITTEITNQNFKSSSINKHVDFNLTGTFPLPDPIQLRSIIILIIGSIPIGIIFILLLYRSRKRRS